MGDSFGKKLKIEIGNFIINLIHIVRILSGINAGIIWVSGEISKWELEEYGIKRMGRQKITSLILKVC